MHKNTYLSAALLWTFSILILCLASFNNLPAVALKNVDKYVHFIFHFVFVTLWFMYYNCKNPKNSIKSILVIFIVSIFFGILIEIAQQDFTTTRKGDISDVFANTTGAFTALIIILTYIFIIKPKLKLK